MKQLEGDGLLSLKGEKLARHRKNHQSAFHMENLKLMVPVVAGRVSEMLDTWSENSQPGNVEIEVSEWFQSLTEDVITRTAFGSSYEDGKAFLDCRISKCFSRQMLSKKSSSPATDSCLPVVTSSPGNSIRRSRNRSSTD
ncbi:unnamed protein product [Rhodiola kirilowii]